jgi:hypothetical protein
LPITTLPFTTRGAPVIVYGMAGSVVCTSQSFAPLFASSAINLPSSAPTNTRPASSATPRFTTSQHARAPASPETCGSKRHSSRPVAASSANTTLHEPVAYITPFATIGVASRPRLVPVA